MPLKQTAIILVTLGLMSGCASAGRYSDDNEYFDTYSSNQFTDKARVLKVKPVYESTTIRKPETRCWNEKIHHRENKSSTPLIAGAIIGGIVGNQFGGGRGKDAMTVAGAILGGSIGNDIAHNQHAGRRVTTDRHCETVNKYHEVNELIGYDVKYRYRGNDFWTRTSTDPGDYIQINVSVSPFD